MPRPGASRVARRRRHSRRANIPRRPQRLQSPSDLTKMYAGKLGFDVASYGAHSLRVGWITSAARRGANIFKISAQSRHKSMDVLRGYVRDSELFQDHAGAGLL
jgi:hypothetical protein